MTAYEDVLQWAKLRPWWQQKVLARILAGETIGDHDHEEIARSLLKEPELSPSGGWFAQLDPPQVTKDESVRILAVRELMNVNRLAPGQELTFEQDGLTVVFGNNGSGKSGYARVIRSMVRTRHQAEILPDVFANESGPQSGQVVFKVGDSVRTAMLGGPSDPDLSRVAFYDEYCGDTYLTTEAEISYRPAAVQLLEDLAAVCNGVRHVIETWKKEISQPGPLPKVDCSGHGGKFLRMLTASTTDDDLAAAVACPSDVADRLEKQIKEIDRLRESEPTREKHYQSNIADALETVADHLKTLDHAVGAQAETRLNELLEKAATAKEAANVASYKTFANEPLSKVGSDTWKKLWHAAELYSTVAYSDHDFPYTADGAVCVLCQQTLDADAAKRLERFHQFVMDTTAKQAADAQSRITNFRADLDRLEVRPHQLLSAITVLEHCEAYKEFTKRQVNSILEDLDNRKTALLLGETPKPVDVTTIVATLQEDAVRHRERAKNVDSESYQKQLAEAEVEVRYLRDQIEMRDGRQLIEAERTRLQKVEELTAKFSEANLSSITKKVGELTRTYVTEEASECFTREAELLDLEHVTFKATKARQGAQLHKTVFLNARPKTRLEHVLSEGEQTSLGFAGFLTEAHFDASKSALIFDDPVSSLDHMKRESVARRIVELARERQVVVFTHDIAFTMLLRKAAEESNVPFGTRSIEKRRKKGPGYTTLVHPWTARDANQRVETLRQEVMALLRTEEGMSEEDYQRETEKIAVHMSQTWERIISQVVAEPLVDYKSLEVRVGKLRVIGRITNEDVKTYDDSYHRISGWASRHDPHPELNYSPPTIKQLNDEIEVIARWLKKVKKYQSS